MTPRDGSDPTPRRAGAAEDWALVRRTALVVATIAAIAFLWYVRDIVVLIFGALLVAIVLTALAEQLQRVVPIRYGWALAAVVIAIAGFAGLVIWLFGTRIATQFTALWQSLPRGVDQLRSYFQNSEWGSILLSEAEGWSLSGAGGIVWWITSTIAGSFLGILSTAFLIIVAGIYFAAQPTLYRHGAVSLVPRGNRARVRRLLEVTEIALRRWLVGQVISMTIIGLLTTLGLLALGVSPALALGLIAGIAEFIPIIGPIVAAIPAILIAATDGFMNALYVTLFYIALQQIEGNLLYPLIQREAVSLPPIVTIFAVVIFGAIVGPIGVLFATPLAVVMIVWVKILYLEGVLKEKIELPGQ